ncbi:hypothetical protein QQS21_001108 [Conoideocrella luteorostrata]|uniref:Peroxisomal membrane protein PEX14 n=1 Tax=Conoideocrella luteorostrata TaxID=1105319 RepID=A0AAJ0CYH7_9HYPO|nr:hypothetical protein QQS21_001108 [Conoideocrella luteorostrata]
MGDSGDITGSASAIPSWQRDGASNSGDTKEKPTKQAQQDEQVEVARCFLKESQVKSASREKKIEFLESKGISSNDIEKLLSQSEEDSESLSQIRSPKSKRTESSATNENSSPSASTNDRPPIVIFPEFLVKPQRPPPLVTKNGLFNTLYAFAGLSTLLYGTSKYLVAPMVDNLTDAQTELHEVTSKKLDILVAQLEKTVSVIPPALAKPASLDDNDASDVEDPAEMFHRDIGTQTSVIDANTVPATKPSEPASKRHVENLASLAKTLSVLKDQFRAQSEGFEDVKTLLDVFRDDLDGMTYGGATEFIGGYDIYSTAKKNEPEDEIRKARDNIRRVKGVLLSTRNFPASTR